ncbi:unnamed protein product [Rotaria socialis]|uniref:BRCT domain-containing protein n=1 Tax=Rotaria socialis TaxID=392032 RepID=A0A817VKW5_9BILA|nr:unnamed protein product [Rotaria socialis]CAF4301839.1 unnamed protein product [Rotaria socialis]
MVDPYDFVASPSTIRSKQTRKKTIVKTSKKRKSNEKPRRVSIRQANSKSNKSTRSNLRDTDHLIDMHEKENNPNNGFTQLIQTKMMEVKKQQGKRTNKKVRIVTDDNRSPLTTKKRQRTETDDNSDMINDPTEIGNNHPLCTTTNEHVKVAKTKTKHPPICESKDHFFVMTNKRRRACLCSKRQLDELEFAPDSAPTQTPQRYDEEQQLPEKSYLEPNLTCAYHSPLPLLLPSSPLMPPLASTIDLEPVQSISANQQQVNHEDVGKEEEDENKEEDEEEEEEEEEDENKEEDEEENQLHATSMMAAPLSPAMPLNTTYIAHRSIPLMAQIPSAVLSLSTGILRNTTTIVSNNTQTQLTASTVEHSNVEQHKINLSLSLPPVKLISNRKDQETSMTPTAVQTIKCSVSTQTGDDDYPIHHPCNDVSVCPCVQIYARSEQLFMTSMSVFFRNTITVTPREQLFATIKNTNRTNNRQQQQPQINESVTSSEPTPNINQTEIPMQIESRIEKDNNPQINETYLINNNNDTVTSIEPEPGQTSHVLLDTSTVIHETPYDNSKKSDGSSIKININSIEESIEKAHEEHSSFNSSIDQQNFKSLVLAMTALKDDQKIEFNRFIERFSVRSSTSIDETTTHLITDEDNENPLRCPLTGKVLQAVARHLKIISYRWLTACLNQQRYVDEIPTYEIIGDTVYNEHSGMSRSRLNNSIDYRLLANYAFHFKCTGCQPFIDNRPLIELIHLSGGLILKTLNQHIDNTGRQIIILCSKKYLQNKPALQQACQKLNILCIEPEWLIASIVKFDLQPFEPWLCTLYS